MSKFTTEVRFICETANGLTESQGFTSIQNILSTAAPTVFDFSFPIFDETYRLPLEIKILRHYYTREICEETVGLWKLRLADRLNMIMPYYNKLYESELLKFNPFYDVDLTTIHKKDTSGNEDKTKDGLYSRTGIDKSDKTQTVEGSATEGSKYHDITHKENENRDEINRNGSKNSDATTTATSNNKTFGNAASEEKKEEQNIGMKEGESSGSANTAESAKGSNIGSNESWDLYSDTPQGGIDGVENAASGIAGNGYLTNARNIKQDNIATNENEGNKNTEESSKNSENNFSSNRGTTTNNSSTTGESTDEGVGTTKTIDTENESENRISNENASGFASGNKDIVRKNDNTTVDSAEAIASVKGETNGKESLDFNNTEEYVEHIVGKQGIRSYSKMLEEFRQTFLNIDKMIIDELSDLFFGLWE